MGQDFGNIPSSKFGYYDKSCDEFENENPDPYAEFDKNNTDVDYFFRFYGNDISKTDDNLRHLFKSIDYEDIRKNRSADLFFTIICLMYRKGNESGGFKKSDCNEEDLHAFKELVHILEPTVIICLGRITFELVLKSFDLPRIKGKFRKIVEDNRNPSIIYHTENNLFENCYSSHFRRPVKYRCNLKQFPITKVFSSVFSFPDLIFCFFQKSLGILSIF